MKRLFERQWFNDIDNEPGYRCGFAPWMEYDDRFALYRGDDPVIPNHRLCRVYYYKHFEAFTGGYAFFVGHVVCVRGKWLALPAFGKYETVFVDSEQDGANLLQAMFLMDGRYL